MSNVPNNNLVFSCHLSPVTSYLSHLFRLKESVMSDFVSETGDNSFEADVLGSDKPVLVDFWAPWCAPCRMLAPTVDAVAEKYSETARVVKLNVDDNPAVSQRYGIKGIPTLILFKGGKEEERVVGATSKEAISRMIDKHVSAASA